MDDFVGKPFTQAVWLQLSGRLGQKNPKATLLLGLFIAAADTIERTCKG